MRMTVLKTRIRCTFTRLARTTCSYDNDDDFDTKTILGSHPNAYWPVSAPCPFVLEEHRHRVAIASILPRVSLKKTREVRQRVIQIGPTLLELISSRFYLSCCSHGLHESLTSLFQVLFLSPTLSQFLLQMKEKVTHRRCGALLFQTDRFICTMIIKDIYNGLYIWTTELALRYSGYLE